jgi:hypothetical protein
MMSGNGPVSYAIGTDGKLMPEAQLRPFFGDHATLPKANSVAPTPPVRCPNEAIMSPYRCLAWRQLRLLARIGMPCTEALDPD